MDNLTGLQRTPMISPYDHPLDIKHDPAEKRHEKVGGMGFGNRKNSAGTAPPSPPSNCMSWSRHSNKATTRMYTLVNNSPKRVKLPEVRVQVSDGRNVISFF
ncbi:hypothetical protein COOONC_20373 [Cooperia oncophora]